MPRAHSGWSIWRQLGNSCSKHSLADLLLIPVHFLFCLYFLSLHWKFLIHCTTWPYSWTHLFSFILYDDVSLFFMCNIGNISWIRKNNLDSFICTIWTPWPCIYLQLSSLTSTHLPKIKALNYFFHCLCLILAQPINSLNMNSTTCSLSVSQKYFLHHWLWPGWNDYLCPLSLYPSLYIFWLIREFTHCSSKQVLILQSGSHWEVNHVVFSFILNGLFLQTLFWVSVWNKVSWKHYFFYVSLSQMLIN